MEIAVLFFILCPQATIAGEWITATNMKCMIWNESPEPKEAVAWSGQCIDGHASGFGVLQWYQDGKRTDYYEGQMSKGTMHGKGIYIAENGDKYEGDFLNNKEHGKGTSIWMNGDKYTGSLKEGKAYGKGVYIYADGGKYEGDFLDGTPHGNGSFIWSTGDKYIGNVARQYFDRNPQLL